jgi:methylmalonyl-CoA/ethylmalonyl-CoA epimerase
MTSAILAGLHPARLFHVGVTAVDFDAAKAELSRSLGVEWKGDRPTMMDLVLDGEERRLEMRIAHTVQGPPHIELIRCAPDTPWAQASEGVHHLCYWAEDSVAACAAMEACGARRVTGRPGSGVRK